MTSNANEVPIFGDLTNVSADKLQELETLLTTILASPIAKATYAQIIDGMPLRTPFSDVIKATESGMRKTIIVGDRKTPSDRALQEYEKMRTIFAPKDLKLDLKLAQAYQNASPGSSEHLLRLLEIAAASVHALAGIVYASHHEDLELKPPMPPGGHHLQFHLTDDFYVKFYHTNYQRFEDYPLGLLSVIGYWAEAELFGGVVLFEREKSGLGIVNAFLHPQRTPRAFQLSIGQLEWFANLGRPSDAARSFDAETVLPFAEEANARTELTFRSRGEPPLRIYKNEYDKPPFWGLPVRKSCVIRKGDPRFESWEETMKIVKEKGWVKEPSDQSNAASSSKDDPHATKDKNP